MRTLISGLVLLLSLSANAGTKDFLYGCRVTLFSQGGIAAWSVEELLAQVDQKATYQWYYRGRAGELAQDVLDREVTGAECKQTSDWNWYCDDARDKGGYSIPCNRENLNKVVRYIRK